VAGSTDSNFKFVGSQIEAQAATPKSRRHRLCTGPLLNFDSKKRKKKKKLKLKSQLFEFNVWFQGHGDVDGVYGVDVAAACSVCLCICVYVVCVCVKRDKKRWEREVKKSEEHKDKRTCCSESRDCGGRFFYSMLLLCCRCQRLLFYESTF
jgi:hypothetical protein